MPMVETTDFQNDLHVNKCPDALNPRRLGNREGGAVCDLATFA